MLNLTVYFQTGLTAVEVTEDEDIIDELQCHAIHQSETTTDITKVSVG